ncbi:hypothetical protein FF011L_38630 [Roseimaritima multifibrata]|uniref:Uncharacterized protein n=1 Tax=Roseimaritima multifibrata TaxID=1930274 RepID=A0A517MJL6_9BACT|nr:hypothetical protein FF011L_38630 [Roseimaritima multifibrata]
MKNGGATDHGRGGLIFYKHLMAYGVCMARQSLSPFVVLVLSTAVLVLLLDSPLDTNTDPRKMRRPFLTRFEYEYRAAP